MGLINDASEAVVQHGNVMGRAQVSVCRHFSVYLSSPTGAVYLVPTGTVLSLVRLSRLYLPSPSIYPYPSVAYTPRLSAHGRSLYYLLTVYVVRPQSGNRTVSCICGYHKGAAP